jgi:hypothetical protein
MERRGVGERPSRAFCLMQANRDERHTRRGKVQTACARFRIELMPSKKDLAQDVLKEHWHLGVEVA